MSGPFIPPFRFGAEVYTWFMKEHGKAHANCLDHMIRVSAEAGFTGIEPVHSWMGDLSDPARLEDELRKAGIDLAAVALVLEWNGPEETGEERRQADETIRLLQRFPGALLCIVQIPTGRHELEARRQHLVSIVNAVSRRAADAGVVATFHPNSPHTSINRTEEDYRIILEGLDASVTGWTPDVGHIANGGYGPACQDAGVCEPHQPRPLQGLGRQSGIRHHGKPERSILRALRTGLSGRGTKGGSSVRTKGLRPWMIPMA